MGVPYEGRRDEYLNVLQVGDNGALVWRNIDGIERDLLEDDFFSILRALVSLPVCGDPGGCLSR